MTWIEILEKAQELNARIADELASRDRANKALLKRNHNRTMKLLGNTVEDDDGDDDE